MKSFGKISLLLLAIFIFTSCEKDCVFRPKEKIEYVRESSKTVVKEYNPETGEWESNEVSVPQHIVQKWNWNRNVLKSITYYDDNEQELYTDDFEYVGKQLSRISWGTEWSYKFDYDGNDLISITYSDGNFVHSIYTISHKKGKISKITFTDYDLKNADHPLPDHIWNYLLPNGGTHATAQWQACLSKMNEQKTEALSVVEFSWTGDNITKMTVTSGTESYIVAYGYDNKLNPLRGLLSVEEMGYLDSFSKNNVVEESLVDAHGNVLDNTKYTYTYMGNYPETKSYHYIYETEDVQEMETLTLKYDYK